MVGQMRAVIIDSWPVRPVPHLSALGVLVCHKVGGGHVNGLSASWQALGLRCAQAFGFGT